MTDIRPINNTTSVQVNSVNSTENINASSVSTTESVTLANTKYWYEQAKMYAGQASESATSASAAAEIATNQAGLAELSASAASTSEDNAQIWAEGEDEEVEELGGTHSAKEWALYVVNNAPTITVEEITGGVLVTATDLQGTTTATVYDGEKGEQGIQGETGERGPSAVVVSTTEPTDPEVEIWLNPSGQATAPLLCVDGGRADSIYTSEQMIFGGNA